MITSILTLGLLIYAVVLLIEIKHSINNIKDQIHAIHHYIDIKMDKIKGDDGEKI